MFFYLIRRLGFLLLTILLTSVIIFIVTQWLPGDVARVILGREAGEQALDDLRRQLGLNDPLPTQYIRWLTGFISGDWGHSFSMGIDIRSLVLERLGNSLRLAAMTLVMGVPLAVMLGVLAGLNEDTWIDNSISISSLTAVGLPEFVTGLVIIEIFALQLGWLPASSIVRPDASFFESLTSLVLPALTATFVLMAYIVRLTRVGVIEELKKPYVRTAELKGLPYRTIVFRHVLRNALLPTITILAISTGWLISGLVVIENVFNYPGLGRLLVFAIGRNDLPVIQAVTMVTAIGFAIVNLVTDLFYSWLNPRIRLGV